jgi:23S rRNA-intervening sequence protein
MGEHTNDNSKEQSPRRQGIRRGRRRPHWRFEDLESWKKALDLAVKFHLIAERLDKRRFYRYAEQLRAAGLSISNNIAEGSGSAHKQNSSNF